MTDVQRFFTFVAAVLLAASAAGCSEDAAPTTPTTIAPPSITDTFSGSLIQFGTNMHTFTVSQLGEVDVTLNAATLQPAIDPTTGESIPPPDPKAVPALTLAIGTPTTTIFGPACATLSLGTTVFSIEAQAATKPHIVGSALAGSYCVSLADTTGVLTNVVDYTIVVAHP